MSKTERLSRQDRKARGEALMQKALQEERALSKKMESIVTFPGNLQEYEQMTGEKYELINQNLFEGGVVPWGFLHIYDDKPPVPLGFINPLNSKIGLILRSLHSEILERAAKLDADAIICYTKTGSYDVFESSFRETGIPIRRINQAPEAVKSK